jgi:excisionase family DNA binding protein
MNRGIEALDHSETHTQRLDVDDHRFGDELLTVRDAARLLNVTVSWVYEHTRDDAEDRLPFVKLGKYVRFDRTDLREYVDAKRQATRTEPADVDGPTPPRYREASEGKTSHSLRGGSGGSKTVSSRLFVQAWKAAQGLGGALAGGRVAGRRTARSAASFGGARHRGRAAY